MTHHPMHTRAHPRLQDDPTQNSTLNAPHAQPGLQDDPTQNSTFNAPRAHLGLQDDPTQNSTFNAPHAHPGLQDDPTKNPHSTHHPKTMMLTAKTEIMEKRCVRLCIIVFVIVVRTI